MQEIEIQRIRDLDELDHKPKLLVSEAKTYWPIFLEDKLVHLVLKKPKRIVVGVFQTEVLADEVIEELERENGKKEFYKRKLKMNKSVYQKLED